MDDEREAPIDQLEADDEREEDEHEGLGDAGSGSYGSLLGSGSMVS